MTRVGLSPLAWLDEVEQQRRAAGLRRSLRTRAAVGTELDLASNDYLGLARHPEVIEGGVEALRTWGAGSTGSRLVTGNTELHEDFESALADFVGAESALVFSSGYTANLGRRRRAVGSGIAAGVRRTDARLTGRRLPVVAGPRRGDAASRRRRRRGRPERPRRRPCGGRDGFGVQRRRRDGAAAGAARRLPQARCAAHRRRGARPRGPWRWRPWAAARGRPCRCARRGDDDDAVQGPGQPGWRGAGSDGGAQPPDRRGAALHLRHRAGARGRRRGGGRSSGAGRRAVAGRRGASACGDACRDVAASPRRRTRRWSR